VTPFQLARDSADRSRSSSSRAGVRLRRPTEQGRGVAHADVLGVIGEPVVEAGRIPLGDLVVTFRERLGAAPRTSHWRKPSALKKCDVPYAVAASWESRLRIASERDATEASIAPRA